MQYHGVVTDIDPDMSLEDGGFDLTGAIVSPDRIAIDWQEDDWHYGMILHPVSSDAVVYEGEWRIQEVPRSNVIVDAYRWDLPERRILLLAKWRDSSEAGVCLFELEPGPGD